MKTAIFIITLVSSVTMLHAQEPVVDSHFNETVAKRDSLMVSIPTTSTDEPDYFKIESYNAAEQIRIIQDSINQRRRNEKPAVNTNSAITDR